MKDTTKQDSLYWSMTEGVYNCLIDTDRSLAFKNAIENTVKKDDVVIDMGSGTGVLAMIAAKSGARKVYAIEIDNKNILTLRNTFRDNGFENIIEVIEGDVTKIELPEKVDVIIAEMIATGLIEELQIPAMNNILKYSNDGVKVVLNKFQSSLDLVYNNNDYYGFKFNIVRYEYPGDDRLKSKTYTEQVQYLSIDFSKMNTNTTVDKKLDLIILDEGIINGIRINDKTTFVDGSQFNSSFAYSYPIILPINEIKVKKGDIYTVNISYKLCGGFDKLIYSIIKN